MDLDSTELDELAWLCISFVMIIVLCFLVFAKLYTGSRTPLRSCSEQGQDFIPELPYDNVPCHLGRVFTAAGSSTDEEETVPTRCAPEISEEASSEESELSLPGSLHSDGGSVSWHSEFDVCREAHKFSDNEADSESRDSSGLESEFSSAHTLNSGRESSDSALSSTEEDLPNSNHSNNAEHQGSDDYIAEFEAESHNCVNLHHGDSYYVPSLTYPRSDDSDQSPQRPSSVDLPRNGSNQSVANLTDPLNDDLSENSAMNDQFRDNSHSSPEFSAVSKVLNITSVQSPQGSCTVDSLKNDSNPLTDPLHEILSQNSPMNNNQHNDDLTQSPQVSKVTEVTNSNPVQCLQSSSLQHQFRNESNPTSTPNELSSPVPAKTDQLNDDSIQSPQSPTPPDLFNGNSNRVLTVSDPFNNESRSKKFDHTQYTLRRRARGTTKM